MQSVSNDRHSSGSGRKNFVLVSNVSEIIEIERVEQLEEGDHDRFAHYVEKDELMKALVEGLPVVALCGKIWVPSRDPDKFPLCPACKEIYEELLL